MCAAIDARACVSPWVTNTRPGVGHLAEPGGQLGVVGVGGEALQLPDTRPDGHHVAVDLDRVGAVHDGLPRVPGT